VSRPTDWTPLNWYQDPVPGDPDVVAAAATRYGSVAESIQQAARDLVRVFEDEQLKGESFDALREIAAEVSGRIGRAHERYHGVSVALEGYVAPLRTAQSDSATVLSQAESNRTELAAADERVTHWDEEFRRLSMAGDPTAPDALERLQYWEQRRSSASQDVTGLITQLNTIIATRDTAATTAANAIAEVENSGDLNDDFWDNVDQFIDENPWIQTVLDVAGYVAAALAIIAMFVPGLNLIVGIIVAVITIATVVYAWAKAASGNGSLGDALFQTAMAIIPFGLGKGLSALARSNAVGAGFATVMAKIPRSGNPAVANMTAEQALGRVMTAADDAVPDILKNMPTWMKAGDSGFAEMLGLQSAARSPLLPNTPLSTGMQNWADASAWLFGAEVVGTGAQPFIKPFEDAPNSSLRNADW